MTTNRSISRQLLRCAAGAALLGVLAVAACNRAPTPPEKLTIAPATPGTASGFAALRREQNENRQQEASDDRFDVAVSYVFIDPDMPEYYDVVLLEKPLDGQMLAEASDPSDAVDDALQGGANGVVLTVDGDGDVSGSFRMSANGKSVQFGGSGTGKVRGLVREGDRVKGHLHYIGSVFSDHIAIDAAFDAQLLQPPVGKPLPPDGGDAGAAFLDTIAAMRAGDVDRLVALMPPERAKMIEAERTKPDFAQNVEMLKAMAPEKVEVTGGTSFGERVVLTTKGTDGDSPFTGTVEMNWEAGGWRMGRQSNRMGGSDAAASDEKKAPHADEPPIPDVLPVHVADGAVGRNFRHGDADFAPTEAFAVALPPAEFGEGRILVLLAAEPLEPKNAKAMWDDATPVGALFADGKGHPSIWLNLGRTESGEISLQKAMFVDAEGNFDDGWLQLSAVETGGRLVGLLTQSMQVDDEKIEGVARFNLPVLAAP